MFHLCSHIAMTRIDQELIAIAILSAPGWARVGITAPKPCLREDAALALARAIAETVETPPVRGCEAQFALPLER